MSNSKVVSDVDARKDLDVDEVLKGNGLDKTCIAGNSGLSMCKELERPKREEAGKGMNRKGCVQGSEVAGSIEKGLDSTTISEKSMLSLPNEDDVISSNSTIAAGSGKNEKLEMINIENLSSSDIGPRELKYNQIGVYWKDKESRVYARFTWATRKYSKSFYVGPNKPYATVLEAEKEAIRFLLINSPLHRRTHLRHFRFTDSDAEEEEPYVGSDSLREARKTKGIMLHFPAPESDDEVWTHYNTSTVNPATLYGEIMKKMDETGSNGSITKDISTNQSKTENVEGNINLLSNEVQSDFSDQIYAALVAPDNRIVERNSASFTDLVHTKPSLSGEKPAKKHRGRKSSLSQQPSVDSLLSAASTMPSSLAGSTTCGTNSNIMNILGVDSAAMNKMENQSPRTSIPNLVQMDGSMPSILPMNAIDLQTLAAWQQAQIAAIASNMYYQQQALAAATVSGGMPTMGGLSGLPNSMMINPLYFQGGGAPGGVPFVFPQIPNVVQNSQNSIDTPNAWFPHPFFPGHLFANNTPVSPNLVTVENHDNTDANPEA